MRPAIEQGSQALFVNGLDNQTVAVTADDRLTARQLELDRNTDGLVAVIAEKPHLSRRGVRLGYGSTLHMGYVLDICQTLR
jgi:hypothetical protein